MNLPTHEGLEKLTQKLLGTKPSIEQNSVGSLKFEKMSGKTLVQVLGGVSLIGVAAIIYALLFSTP